MKNLIVVILSIMFITSCEELGVGDDKCDGNVRTEIYVGMEVNVFVKTEREMNWVDIKSTCSKEPCGEAVKGVYPVTQKVRYDSDKMSFKAQFKNSHYYLRNSLDKVLVDVTCTDGFGQIKGFSYSCSYDQLAPYHKDWYPINVDIDYNTTKAYVSIPDMYGDFVTIAYDLLLK